MINTTIEQTNDSKYVYGILYRNNKEKGVEGEFRIRKLTPKECFRLQGFPDKYFYKAQQINSDTQLYQQTGNSVTVPVVYEIAKRLPNI